MYLDDLPHEFSVPDCADELHKVVDQGTTAVALFTSLPHSTPQEVPEASRLTRSLPSPTVGLMAASAPSAFAYRQCAR